MKKILNFLENQDIKLSNTLTFTIMNFFKVWTKIAHKLDCLRWRILHFHTLWLTDIDHRLVLHTKHGSQLHPAHREYHQIHPSGQRPPQPCLSPAGIPALLCLARHLCQVWCWQLWSTNRHIVALIVKQMNAGQRWHFVNQNFVKFIL